MKKNANKGESKPEAESLSLTLHPAFKCRIAWAALDSGNGLVASSGNRPRPKSVGGVFAEETAGLAGRERGTERFVGIEPRSAGGTNLKSTERRKQLGRHRHKSERRQVTRGRRPPCVTVVAHSSMSAGQDWGPYNLDKHEGGWWGRLGFIYFSSEPQYICFRLLRLSVEIDENKTDEKGGTA